VIECRQRSFCVLAVYWTQSRAALVLECTQIASAVDRGRPGLREGAPDPVGVAEDPGRRWGFLPGRGAWVAPSRGTAMLFYVSRHLKRITSMKTLTTLH